MKGKGGIELPTGLPYGDALRAFREPALCGEWTLFSCGSRKPGATSVSWSPWTPTVHSPLPFLQQPRPGFVPVLTRGVASRILHTLVRRSWTQRLSSTTVYGPCPGPAPGVFRRRQTRARPIHCFYVRRNHDHPRSHSEWQARLHCWRGGPCRPDSPRYCSGDPWQKDEAIEVGRDGNGNPLLRWRPHFPESPQAGLPSEVEIGCPTASRGRDPGENIGG
jgi:hypothetical protein